MTINYSIDENDFLTHQLYIASKSQRIKKRRMRNKIFVPVIYFLFALYGYLTDKPTLMIIFIVIAVLWFLLYSPWEKKHYINHYKGFIAENYKEKINKTCTLTFSDDFIFTKENENESKVSTKEIEKIVEIKTLIFMKLKNGLSLILPKNKINEIVELKTYLKEFANSRKIDYTTEEDWKWK